MKKAVALLCLMLFFTASAVAQKEWVGTYTFDEDGGRNAGGTAIFIAHQLTVLETDDGLIAHLESNGYQTSKDLNLKGKATGSKLELYFESYGENNVFETYDKGDLLFTLQRRIVKGRSELLTFWGKFTPIVPRNEKTGKVYFLKSPTLETN